MEKLLQDLAEQQKQEEAQSTEATAEAPTEAPTEVPAPVVTDPPAPVETTPVETTPPPTEAVFTPERRWLGMDEFLAQSYAVIDLETGETVLSENQELPLEAGGLTRLMTLYTVLTDPAYDPEKPVTLGEISDPAAIFASGETISTEAALFAMFYEASDDAALALVNAYGPERDAFVQKMQQNARSLGMVNTTYFDPLGIERGSQTTAEDTVKLLRSLNNQEPFKAMTRQPAYLLPDGAKYSVSGLASIDNPAAVMDAMSSDYLVDIDGLMVTDSADGWSYGAGAAATNDGRELLAVVMGAATKVEAIEGIQRAAQATRTLLEEGAKAIGVPGVDNRSMLAVSRREAEAQEPEPVVTESVATEPEVKETVGTVAQVQLNEEPEEEDEGLGWLFYVVLAVLAIAVISLIVGSIIMSQRRKRERQMRRRPPMRRPPRPRYRD